MNNGDKNGKDDKEPLQSTLNRSLQRQYGFTGFYTNVAKNFQVEAAASAASLSSTAFSYPLDAIKTRMQTYYFENVTACTVYTYKRDGIPGFWRGVLAPLTSIMIVRAFSFSVYKKASYGIDDAFYRSTGTSPIDQLSVKGGLPTFSTIACFGTAGAISGALATVVGCPFELAKLYSQLFSLMAKNKLKAGGVPLMGPHNLPLPPPLGAPGELIPRGPNIFRVLQTLWTKGGGYRGLYVGFNVHLVRDTIGSSIYFVTYESSKQVMANIRGDEPPFALEGVVSGFFCGLLSWSLIYPIDSAKAIYQHNVLSARPGTPRTPVPVEYLNMARYRGFPISVARSCITNAVFLTVFEAVKKHIDELDDDVD